MLDVPVKKTRKNKLEIGTTGEYDPPRNLNRTPSVEKINWKERMQLENCMSPNPFSGTNAKINTLKYGNLQSPG